MEMFFWFLQLRGCTSSLQCSQAATEQNYASGSKVCCFGSWRQKGKHTQSFPLLNVFITVRLLRINNAVDRSQTLRCALAAT